MWGIILLIVFVLAIIVISKNQNKPVIQSSSNGISKYTYNIVGEASYQKNLNKIAGSKQSNAKKMEVQARVISEPTNKFDENAIKVEINNFLVGYINKHDAKRLAKHKIDKSVPALINGGWLDDESEGHYGVKLAITDIHELI